MSHQEFNLAGNAAQPHGGANCRSGVTAGAWSRLELGSNGYRRIRGGMMHMKVQSHRHKFTQVQGPHGEVTPLLLHCRGGFTAYAWDRLELGPWGTGGSGNSRCVLL